MKKQDKLQDKTGWGEIVYNEEQLSRLCRFHWIKIAIGNLKFLEPGPITKERLLDEIEAISYEWELKPKVKQSLERKIENFKL